MILSKKILLIIFLLIFSATSCKTGKNKKENLNSNEVAIEYFFPEEIHYTEGVGEIIADRFYPIGWSKNGNFAYMIEPADEGLGNYQLVLIVQNLISNEVIWDWSTDPVVGEDLYREDIWKKNYDLFKKNMNKQGIIQIRNMKLESDYFVHKDKDYIISLELTKEQEDDINIEIVKKNKIILTCKQLGKKIVFEDTFEGSLILGQQIAGCFISPYEDRIAILVRSERWGYEGPPNVVEYKIYGANLTTGFQK